MTVRVVCIGGANVDRKAKGLQPLRLADSNPAAMTQTCGGVARNIAENLARAGVPTAMVAAVGDDADGRWLLEQMRAAGIGTEAVIVMPGERTGTYVAMLEPDGELAIAVNDMRILDRLTSDMIDERWPVIAAAELVLLDANPPADVIRHLIGRCSAERIRLCLNPASAVKIGKFPRNLSGVELLVANRMEAAAFTGVKVETADDAREAAGRLLEAGVKQAVITLGKEGLVWANAQAQGHLPPSRVSVVDVTGAGDALMAGVMVGLLEGRTLEHACRIGQHASALTLQSESSIVAWNREQIERLATL
jgi:pseudouridine kinase